MNWDALGAIAEAVGAAAVVATLAYLAIQIRQNTISARSATYQSIVNTSAELAITFSRDESFADLFARGASNPDCLTSAERIRLHAHIYTVFRCYELIFHQYELRAIEKSVWEGWRRNMSRFLRMIGYRSVWESTKAEFPPSFVAEVESVLNEHAMTSRDGNAF